MAVHYSEVEACQPISIREDAFNQDAVLPYGLQASHVRQAMQDFLDFLGFVNTQLHSRDIQRLESMLMPANFSSITGEFMATSIPRYCKDLVKNRYHNGHPDLVPAQMYPNDAVQHSEHGIEIKASRYPRGWQGHNPEAIFLLVFVFDSNRPRDIAPRPFKFVRVLGATLAYGDWLYSGRSETSRRTITASVAFSGYEKMVANWIYLDDL